MLEGLDVRDDMAVLLDQVRMIISVRHRDNKCDHMLFRSWMVRGSGRDVRDNVRGSCIGPGTEK